ncbi:MAG: hypothetical protein AAF399_26575, partial [Bacteroidota bacterium]
MPHLHQSPSHTQSRASAEQQGEQEQQARSSLEGASLPPPPLQLNASPIQRNCGANMSCSEEDPIMSLPPPLMSEGEEVRPSHHTKKRSSPHASISSPNGTSLKGKAGLGRKKEGKNGSLVDMMSGELEAGLMGEGELWERKAGIKGAARMFEGSTGNKGSTNVDGKVVGAEIERSVGLHGIKNKGSVSLIEGGMTLGNSDEKSDQDLQTRLSAGIGAELGADISWDPDHGQKSRNFRAELAIPAFSAGLGRSDKDQDGTPEYHSKLGIGPFGVEISSEDPVGDSPLGNLAKSLGLVDRDRNQTSALWNRFLRKR